MGEVINIQQRYIEFAHEPEAFGFLSADTDIHPRRRISFLHQGEVLVDRRGRGTKQTHPEMFENE